MTSLKRLSMAALLITATPLATHAAPPAANHESIFTAQALAEAADDCILTSWSVGLITPPLDEGTPLLFVAAYRIDVCQTVPLVTFREGMVFNPNAQQKKVSSAFVDESVTMTDLNGETSQATIKLSWSATGEPTRSIDTLHVRTSDMIRIERTHSMAREATVKGTLSIEGFGTPTTIRGGLRHNLASSTMVFKQQP